MTGPRGWGTNAAFGLLIVGALATALGAAALFAQVDRELAAQHLFARAMVERAGAMAGVLSELDPEARAEALDGYHAPGFRVWLSEDEPEPMAEPWRHSDALIEAARTGAPVAYLDDLILHALDGGPARFDPNEEPGPIGAEDWRPGFYALMVGLPLEDGGWVVALAPARPVATRPGSLALLLLGLAVVLVVTVSLIIANRMMRPLRTLASAAERLTADLDSPPLEPRGSREVRHAVDAFNTMQAQLRRAMYDRSVMVAALSHDLRTIITRLRLRAEEIDDETQREKAFRDLADMETMLSEALDAARGEADREERQKADLASLVRSLVDDLADAGETVSYEGPDRLTMSFRPVALRRAVANLIQNALRYAGSAEVSLHDDGAMVTIAVADRGPGIPEDRREAMFRPFMRGDPSRNRDTGGTGLGLSVTRSILRSHGGDVELDTREGGGLVARATLPRGGEG